MSIIPQAPRIWCYAMLLYIKTTDGLNLRKIGNVLTDWSNWVSVFFVFFLCLCLNCKRNKRTWSVLVCLQCLNNVKHLSLFVLAFVFVFGCGFVFVFVFVSVLVLVFKILIDAEGIGLCLQCLNNVNRLSLFVLAWNFTKRAKFAQNSKSNF